MKIGIITFHTAVNYGAVLQTVALHKFVTNIGIENEIINYNNELFKKQYNPIQKQSNIIRNLVRLLLVSPRQYKKNVDFRHFVETNVKISAILCRNDLASVGDEYDFYISGSDQVFCPTLTNGDMSYFLDFVVDNTKKFSYAASLGGREVDFNKYPEALLLLKKFNKISVREQSGLEFLKNYNINSYQHIDPTLLIGKDEWEKIALPVKQENYILLYTLGKGAYVEDTVNEAKKLSEATGKKILRISDKYEKNQGIVNMRYCSPQKFLGLFAKADIVITNSFHGTAFSIIFHKEFYANWNMPNNKGIRISNLLTLCGIVQGNFSDALKLRSTMNIDWNNVENKLIYEKNRSKEFFLSLL